MLSKLNKFNTKFYFVLLFCLDICLLTCYYIGA